MQEALSVLNSGSKTITIIAVSKKSESSVATYASLVAATARKPLVDSKAGLTLRDDQKDGGVVITEISDDGLFRGSNRELGHKVRAQNQHTSLVHLCASIAL